MTQLTPRLISEVSKVLLMGLRKKVNNYKIKSKFELENSLKNMCDIICYFTNKERTSSWGWYFLLEDYEAAFQCFLFEPLDKFMDAVSIIAIEFLNGLVIENLNFVFSENNFGYRIADNPELPWLTVKNIYKNYQKNHYENEEDFTSLNNYCQQTEKYIYNKKIELFKPHNENESKEIIAASFDSFRKLLLKIANTEDLENAIEFFKTKEDIWGPSIITNDGIAELSKLCDDFLSATKMNIEQLIYCIDRILIYVNYLSRITNKL